MGFTPAQINDMSLWEFNACAEGFRKANTPQEATPPPMTPEEFEAGVANHLKVTGQTRH